MLSSIRNILISLEKLNSLSDFWYSFSMSGPKRPHQFSLKLHGHQRVFKSPEPGLMTSMTIFGPQSSNMAFTDVDGIPNWYFVPHGPIMGKLCPCCLDRRIE